MRIVQDKNDFYLGHVVDFIKGRRWGNIKPDYQRRLRWTDAKKSKLIESFVMNVPVPPVFLYEKGVGELEVMDGQQRLTAILEFMEGDLTLEGLEIWRSLNGRTFKKLPPLVRRGLESAKISAITLIADPKIATPGGDHIDLRAQVFDRLNTGGVPLNAQELRNAKYSGAFNKLLGRLSALPNFTKSWGIPDHASHTLSDGTVDAPLRDNKLYASMGDCEIVLRYFAFREEKSISGSVKRILDARMAQDRHLAADRISALEQRFTEVLNLCVGVLGERAFKLPPNVEGGIWKLSRPVFDAQMVGFDKFLNRKLKIEDKKAQVSKAVIGLAAQGSPAYEIMIARANTAQAIKDRIAAVEGAIGGALDG